MLPPTPPTPAYLMHLYSDKECGPEFNRSIRLYNAMFAFTSSGGNVDHSINNGRGPYIYRLNGQNHHVFGQLIPDDGKEPAYCQLYIYDTTNEVNNRLRWATTLMSYYANEYILTYCNMAVCIPITPGDMEHGLLEIHYLSCVHHWSSF